MYKRQVVVIGEGEKDNAPMLYNGEQVGDGTGPECDVAVDPIDGTTLTAKGMTNAVSVMAVAPRGSMYDPSAVFYMEKLVTGPEAADVVDIRYPVSENIHQVAKAKISFRYSGLLFHSSILTRMRTGSSSVALSLPVLYAFSQLPGLPASRIRVP